MSSGTGTAVAADGDGPGSGSEEGDPALAAALELKLQLLVAGCAVDDELPVDAKVRVEAVYGHHTGRPPGRPIPQEIVLHRPAGLRRSEAVVSQVRYNAASPYRLSWTAGGPVLAGPHGTRPVELIPTPGFYARDVTPGVPARTVVQLLGTDLLGIVPSNYCALFSTGEECTFCEIVPHYASHREYRRSIKPDDLQVAALSLGLTSPEVEHVVFTSGNYDLTNERTVEHYERVCGRLSVPDRVRRVYGCLMPPDDPGSLPRLRAAGFTSVILDIEVWDPRHYAGLVPGKARWLGRDGFLRMLDAAVDVFGGTEVYSNLVYGIQSLGSVPDGRRFDAALETERCLEATDGLLARGVLPLFTVYHSAGSSRIGPIALDPAELTRFAVEYGRRVWASGLQEPGRNAVIYGLGSIANHFYNDAYYLAKVRAR